jgi:hypothetical protein
MEEVSDFIVPMTGLLCLRSTTLQHFDRCSSIMDVLKRENQLSKFTQSIESAGLAGKPRIIYKEQLFLYASTATHHIEPCTYRIL